MKIFAKTVILAVFSAALGASASTTPAKRATICNGHPELCERSYGAVTYVGTHNSYAIGPSTNIAMNQDQDITRQLDDGVRMLQVQAHNENGVITLCHGACFLQNGGTLRTYLVTVKSWLDANPNEVLSLLIVNIDNMPATAYGTIFAEAGLVGLSYAPPSSPLAATAWPTLGELIDTGRRLVTFLDNAADLAAVPYLIDEFTNIWETEFNVLDAARFNCGVNRTQGDTGAQMFMINHFLDQLFVGQPVPFVERLNETNAVEGPGSLGAHVQTCREVHGRAPNFLLVDFYEFGGGSVFQVAADINGVPYNPITPIATPRGTNSSSNSTGGASGNGTNTGGRNNSQNGNGNGNGALSAFSGQSEMMPILVSVIASLTLACGAFVL